MPKSVWTSKKKTQEEKRAKFWGWAVGRMAELHINKGEAAKRSGCSPQTFSGYVGGKDMPAGRMVKLLDILEASDEEIIWAVRQWQ